MGQYDRVKLRDDPELITRRMRAMILETERECKSSGIDILFDIVQGSWQPPLAASATTHLKAGVADLWFPGLGNNDKTRQVIRIGRRVGCMTMQLRGPWGTAYGNFDYAHIHTCDLDTTHMDSLAAWQVRPEYVNGFTGLGSGGIKDPVPYRPDPIRKFDFQAYQDLVNARQRVDRLDDRIDDVQDTLESLRKEKQAQQRKIQRMLNH